MPDPTTAEPPVVAHGRDTVDGNTGAREFAPPRKGHRDWKPTWIIAYENTGTVTAACKAAKVSRQRAYEARKTDPVFAEAWKEAQNHVVELLEETAVQKALGGDGRMIEFMLKANRPKKYRESSRVDEAATEEIEQSVNEEIERMAAEVGRLTDRLADVAPGGEASSPRDTAGGALAAAS